MKSFAFPVRLPWITIRNIIYYKQYILHISLNPLNPLFIFLHLYNLLLQKHLQAILLQNRRTLNMLINLFNLLNKIILWQILLKKTDILFLYIKIRWLNTCINIDVAKYINKFLFFYICFYEGKVKLLNFCWCIKYWFIVYLL